jgi:hypothetical protein
MPRTGNKARKIKVKPGKLSPEPAPGPTPTPEPLSVPDTPGAIPASLLAALEKMETTGAVPVMITRLLEAFLTEQGVYRDDMTPAEAWDELHSIAIAAGKPEPPAAS